MATLLEGADGNAQAVGKDVVFWRDGMLLAQELDLASSRLTGPVIPIAEQVQGTTSNAVFGVSANGVVVYAPAAASLSQLTWLDRAGREVGTVGTPAVHETLHLSPDGRLIAVGRSDRVGGPLNLWIIDPQRNVSTRLTFGVERESNPAWSPDGRRIAFNSTRQGVKSLYDMASTGGDERLLMAGGSLSVSDRSKDDRYLIYNNDTTRDLFALPLSGDRKPIRVVHPTSGRADQPTFSPDSRWIAYNAEESGRAEVYLTPFPPTGAKWQVSSAGGVQPRWRGDGRELFYVGLDGTMMALDAQPSDEPHAGMPHPLFKTDVMPLFQTEQYEVSADGQRFLVMKPLADNRAASLNLVVNWPALAGSQ
jgi:Tol biopolymer transport system component